MKRAYDVMTRAIASVTPTTPVAQAATMMRDLNIGDLLVIQDGTLRGIVTDRDLTIKVLTNGANTKSPVEQYMTTDVVTGSPDWTLERVAEVMGKHQIRRLPIVQDQNVVGIVSLGDVAVHTSKRETVADSLKNISESTRTRFKQAAPLTKLVGLAVPVVIATGVLLFANSNSGKRVRKQIGESELGDQARLMVNEAVRALQDPHTRQAVIDALAATGIPEKARNALQEGVNTLQTTQQRADQITNDWSRQGARVSEEAMHFADQTRAQVSDLPRQLKQRFQKPKRKRFLGFA